jgi:superfamily II DNA helicase RecQ
MMTEQTRHVKIFSLPFDPIKEAFDDTALQEFSGKVHIEQTSDHLFNQNGKMFLTVIAQYKLFDDAPVTQKDVVGQAEQNRNKPTLKKSDSKNGAVNKANSKTDDPQKKPYQPKGLSNSEMVIFEALRKKRFQRAKSQEIPAYAVCTNQELETIIKTVPNSVSEVHKIKGMGGKKANAHGRFLLNELAKLLNNPN